MGFGYSREMNILVLTAEDAVNRRRELGDLLRDAVDSGASIGYVSTPTLAEADAYWDSVIAAVFGGSRVLMVAQGEDGAIAGSVQLDLEQRPNGNHRAEMIKLFVLRSMRRRGIARALLAFGIDEARRRGRMLLTMDTRKGGDAERLCEQMGFQRMGEIPRYARSVTGELEGTVFFYYWIPGGS